MRNLVSQISKKIAEIGTKRSNRWITARRHHLLVQPFCQFCGSEKNLQVHHIQPFHLHPELELEPTNFITLCETFGMEHHLHVGHLGSWKKCNPNVLEDCKNRKIS